jgi:hypothetical protein
MKPDKIRNKDDTSAMSLSSNVPATPSIYDTEPARTEIAGNQSDLSADLMNSNAKNVRKEPVNGMSKETPDYTPSTAPTPGTAEPVCPSNG